MKYTNDSDKKDVLIAALEERYEAMRVIRERVQSIGVWVLGLMLAAAGWLTQRSECTPLQYKILYLIALCLVFWALRYKYLNDLWKGFSSQQRVAVRIEKTLGLYMPGVFDSAEDAIYPSNWEQAGKPKSDGKFFNSTYLLLYIGFIILALAILLR